MNLASHISLFSPAHVRTGVWTETAPADKGPLRHRTDLRLQARPKDFTFSDEHISSKRLAMALARWSGKEMAAAAGAPDSSF